MARFSKKQAVILSVVAVIGVGIGTGSYFGKTKKGIDIEGAAGFKELKNASFDPAKSGNPVYTIKTEPRKTAPPPHG